MPTHQSPKKQKSGGKKKYQVRNWKEYNQALVNRGSAIFWITEEALKNWKAAQQKKRKRGRPTLYNAVAIQTALTLGLVFHLPLRQSEGFLRSILSKLDTDCHAPDYSTLSKRGGTLPVTISVRSSNEPIHLVVDSTGIKVYGEGEWKVRQHGWSKRRTWKKLHIGVDEKTGDILVAEATGNDTADCTMLEPLLSQLPNHTTIDQVSADGAYDRQRCYDALGNKGVPHIAIPPQKNAKIWQHGNRIETPHPRDENLRRIRAIGRKQWKKEINYHRRSLVETAMYRLKTIFGDKVPARTSNNQRTQLLLRCRALNWMTTLGMPESVVVA